MNAIKNILITGATSYTGQNLAKYLESQNFKIFSLIRKSSEIKIIKKLEKISTCLYGNNYKSIKKILDKNKIDCVIHLAAVSKYVYAPEEIGDIMESNIKLGATLLEAMSRSNCNRFINFGTSLQDDTHKTPSCLYAALKQSFEDILKFYSTNHKINFISLRLTDICGPNDPRQKFLSYLKKYQEGVSIAMTEGNQEINLIHIDDVMLAVNIALNIVDNSSHNNSPYYVYGNETLSLKQIVDIYRKQSGKNLKINWGKLPYRQNQMMQLNLGQPLPKFKAKYHIKDFITTL